MAKRVLLVRQDNNGDVLLTGPAVRAVAAAGAYVTYLCGPRGRSAAELLPGVDEVLCEHAAWIDAQPEPVDAAAAERFIARLRARSFDEAIIFTSFHQSPLPAALLLRMAGVARIAAISVDYPGSLLDIRHHVCDDVHEVERNLSLVATLGYHLSPADDGRLRINLPPASPFAPAASYVVVHPGATVPARAWSAQRNRELVASLAGRGDQVVVTGDARERDLCDFVSGEVHGVYNLAGATTFGQYGALLRDARAVICGNTAAVHVAAAVGTPVVELFAPTIPLSRFAPWRVPFRALGEQEITCRGCRARICPYENQPCLSSLTPDDVIRALDELLVQSSVPRSIAV
ncbi:MAG TPA: glycosyltransferase family 9 protein [Candidatus Acidoferrales bacterium]|nr:glycosyltransferase family 9 protein [Candidatus Acidoferrales bacterium]